MATTLLRDHLRMALAAAFTAGVNSERGIGNETPGVYADRIADYLAHDILQAANPLPVVGEIIHSYPDRVQLAAMFIGTNGVTGAPNIRTTMAAQALAMADELIALSLREPVTP